MITGIYKITCLATNKMYIGSSYNCLERWYKHKSALNLKKHCNKYLQNAWNKYKAANFIVEILEECSQDVLLDREQYWLDFYKAYDRKIGFNIVDIAKNGFATIFLCTKSYLVISPTGERKIIDNLEKYAYSIGLKPHNLRSVALGQCWDYGDGWHCRYAHETIEDWQKRQKRGSKGGKNPCHWKITLVDNQILIYSSINKFAKDYNYNLASIQTFIHTYETRKNKTYQNIKLIEKIPIDNTDDLNKWR